jgi:hypothetical protein
MRILKKDHFLDSRYTYTRLATPNPKDALLITNTKYYNIPHSILRALLSLHSSNPSPLRPLALPIIPTNSPSQSPPQNPLFRRDLLLIFCSDPLFLACLPDHLTLPQRLEHNLILGPRKINQTHSLAPCLLARRADHSMKIAPQDRRGEAYQGIPEVDD